MVARSHFRAFGRREVSLPATLTVDSEAPRTVRLLNISLGGACVELSAPPVEGAIVTLEVTTPILWDPLVIRATVAWARGIGLGQARAGMRFHLEHRTALKNLIDLLGSERFE